MYSSLSQTHSDKLLKAKEKSQQAGLKRNEKKTPHTSFAVIHQAISMSV